MPENQFTMPYCQPSEAPFSLDSVELASRIAPLLPPMIPETFRVLDLCAGCGIIGLDLSIHRPDLRNLDFVDIQKDHETFFFQNLKERNRRYDPPLQAQWYCLNYADLENKQIFHGKYDLILCNPPYFSPLQGKLPPSKIKARSHFFLDSDFPTLVRVICQLLRPGGPGAFLLVRDLHDHKLSWQSELESNLTADCQSLPIGQIRGTPLFKITQVPLS